MSIKTFDLVGTIHGREYTEWGEYVSAVDYREIDLDNQMLMRDASNDAIAYNAAIERQEELRDELRQIKADNQYLLMALHRVYDSLEREYWSEYAGLDETRAILDDAISSPENPS